MVGTYLQSQPSTTTLPYLPRRLETPIVAHPYRLHGALALPHPRHVVPSIRHVRRRRVIEAVLERHHVRHELVVEPRLRHRGPGGGAALQHLVQHLRRGADDAGAARGADDGGQHGALGVGVGGRGRGPLDDDGRDGGQRALAGAHVVGGAGRVAELVAHAGDGEVVHLVVEHDAGLGHHQQAAEEQVDRGGGGHGQALRVRRRHVRRAVVRRRVYLLRVVVLHRLRGVVADAPADVLRVRGRQHGRLEGRHVRDVGRVAQGLVRAVREAHGLVEAVQRQVGVGRGRGERGGVAFHGLQRAEAHGAAAGHARGEQLEPPVGDADGLADDGGVVGQVL